MTGLFTDVRFGARLLLKSPITTAAAILSLATRSNIVRLVLGQAVRIVIGATIVGLGAALLLGASIRALLYEVQPRDPPTLAVAAFVLMATTLAASYVPVRRVLAQNLLASLRND